MGLDMFAFVGPRNDDQSVLPTNVEYGKLSEIAYWRKFNAFHGWMQDQAYDAGFDGEMFNGVYVRFDMDMLDRLERDVNSGNLKPREGFFFGPQEVADWQVDQLKNFIDRARSEIDAGNAVYYDSSW